MTARCVRVVACVALASAGLAPLASDAEARRGGSGVLTQNGRVGSVYVGKATVGRVLRWAGRPTSRSSGVGEGGVSVYELRYACGRGKSSTYFFGARRILANFTTNCRQWRTARGTRVGTSYDEAAVNEGKDPAGAICGGGEVIERRGRRATLFVTFFRAGGLVRALAVAGKNSVLGC
ncbi:MAG TPA: hypothetical protein VF549_08355 [Solirubrobacteraceae bacterium]|jgi:hypothetical protein